ncbi:MAG TPA: hypothetical protein VGN49_11745 [Micrococcaceae bacterium]|jgi:hypothetical protein|nr:hypothetical protein [Micrococcaceae bacterium]
MNTQNFPDDVSSAGTTPTGTTTGAPSTADTTRQEAREVGNTGMEAGQHVASVAKDEAQNVVQEAGYQAQNLLHEFTGNLREQAGVQQQKVAEGLRSISDELKSMAQNNSDNAGTATQWVHQASTKAGDVAGWLERRDPGSLLEEVRRFARRRPGAFLGIAAGAGLLAGRLTRGLTAGGSEGGSGGGRGGIAPGHVPPTPDYHLAGTGGINAPITGQPPSPLDIETGESYGAPMPGVFGAGPGTAQPGPDYGIGTPVVPPGTTSYGSDIPAGGGAVPAPETVYPPAPPEYLPESAQGTEDDTEGRLP